MNKLLVCILLFSTSFVFADEPDKKLHEKCIYPTVKLEIPAELGGGCGSGTIVRSVKNTQGTAFTNVIITAAHNLSKGPVTICVPKFKDWSTVTGFDKFPCVVFSSSTKYDLAILFFESPGVMPTAEFDFDAKFFVGTQIFKLGYGITDECRLDRGEITSVSTSEPPTFTGHLRLNAHTIFGDSGGPVFLNSSYKIIGITRAIRGFQNHFLTQFAYATPLSFLKTWNTESQNTLAFVFDSKEPIPLTVEEIKKRNTLLHLKAQLDGVKKDVIVKTQEIAARKKMEEAIDKEIKRIEEGRELPAPTMPEVSPPLDTPSNTPNNEQSPAP